MNDSAFAFLNFALSRAQLDHSLWWYYPMFFFVGVLVYTIITVVLIYQAKITSKLFGHWLKTYKLVRSILVVIYFVGLSVALTMWMMASVSNEYISDPSTGQPNSKPQMNVLMKDLSRVLGLMAAYLLLQITYAGCTMYMFKDAIAYWNDNRGYYNLP